MYIRTNIPAAPAHELCRQSSHGLLRTKPDFRRSLGAFHPQGILRSTCRRNNAGAAPRTAARIICALWCPHRSPQAQHLRVGAERVPQAQRIVECSDKRKPSRMQMLGRTRENRLLFFLLPCFRSCFPRGGPGGPFGIESLTLCLKARRCRGLGPVMSARAAQTEAGTASIAMRHRLPCGTGLAVNKKTVQILTDKCKVRGMCDGAGASSWREGERVRNREKGSESEERDAQG